MTFFDREITNAIAKIDYLTETTKCLREKFTKKAGSLQTSLLKVVEPILTLYPEPEKPCFLWKVDFSITSDVSTKDDPTAFF